MFKHVEVARKSNGDPIMIPVTMSEIIIEQQVKLLIEVADYNVFDAHMHLSLFHHFHGKKWTLRILQAVLQELQQPSIEVSIAGQRNDWIPFFETEQKTHQRLTDDDYRYPPEDISRLPI
ncbi:MAG TPA: hypothetical protein VNG51_26015 [Ktedonobacteraceae bacterium]|nr:hypothetical protein [Ktedonobacteraceae bacterium]